jgi:hypothetical protein
MWQARLGQPRNEGFSASPVAVDGKVFFTNDVGDTFVVAARASIRLLHVNRIEESTLASPALVDGKWYLRTDRHPNRDWPTVTRHRPVPWAKGIGKTLGISRNARRSALPGAASPATFGASAPPLTVPTFANSR